MSKLLYLLPLFMFMSCAATQINPYDKKSDYNKYYREYLQEGRIYKGNKKSCLKSKKAINFVNINQGKAKAYYYDYYGVNSTSNRIIETINHGKYKKHYTSMSNEVSPLIVKICSIDNNYVVSISEK